MITFSGKKICVVFAAVLLVFLAHPAFGKCPQGSSMSQQSAQGEWCLFCPDGTSATQTIGDGGVSCACGKAECSVTLAGKPSTLAAYQEAITVPSSETMPDVVSTTTESSSETSTTDATMPEPSPVPSSNPTPAAPVPESSGSDASINVNPSVSDATMMKQSMLMLVSVVLGMLIA